MSCHLAKWEVEAEALFSSAKIFIDNLGENMIGLSNLIVFESFEKYFQNELNLSSYYRVNNMAIIR